MFKFLGRLIILGFVIFCGYQTYVVHKNVQNVLQYKDMVKEILDDNDTTANVDLVLAMIYTETKGDDGDVMQSSESSDGVANSITDSQTSIRQGVTVLSENLTLADEAGVDVWTAVQAYNFGTAYIDYVAKMVAKIRLLWQQLILVMLSLQVLEIQREKLIFITIPLPLSQVENCIKMVGIFIILVKFTLICI